MCLPSSRRAPSGSRVVLMAPLAGTDNGRLPEAKANQDKFNAAFLPTRELGSLARAGRYDMA